MFAVALAAGERVNVLAPSMPSALAQLEGGGFAQAPSVQAQARKGQGQGPKAESSPGPREVRLRLSLFAFAFAFYRCSLFFPRSGVRNLRPGPR